MTNLQPIGVIKDIKGGFSFDLLALFGDGMVLVKGSLSHMMLLTLEAQFGVLGVLILHPLVMRAQKKRINAISNKTSAEMIAQNPKNRRILYSQIIDAQLRKSFVSGTLVLKLSDGSTQKFSWMKGSNKNEQVADWLRQALGTKLAEAA